MRFPFFGEHTILNDVVRSKLLGLSFIKLTDGTTHYELKGSRDAQTVVLIHGFSVPSFVWDPTYDALIRAGFRVLRYDLYGRGYSDRLNTKYDLSLFVRQLHDLLTILHINTPLSLIGLSMGGPISVGFANTYPHLIKKLVLISPAGLVQETTDIKLLETPILGELVGNMLINETLKSVLKADFYDVDNKIFSDYVNKYHLQMEYIGFKQSLLSSIRSGLITKMHNAYKKVGEENFPMSLIWGEKDKTVPFELNKKIRGLIPHIEFHPIANAGHNSHYEKPEEVNQLLVSFLKK